MKRLAYSDYTSSDFGAHVHCNKIAYPSQKVAKQRLKEMDGRVSHGGLKVYRCPRCGNWHMGHSSR